MNLRKIVSKITPLIPLILIFYIFIVPLSKPGLIVGGDWTFPLTNEQLKVFADNYLSIWTSREIPTGSQVPHQNTYPLNILAGTWAALGLDGVSFQKFTLFVTVYAIYGFAYLLLFRFTKNRFASVVGALSYLFTPLVFNYINMGWNLVLVFMALAPVFVLLAWEYFEEGKISNILILGFLCALGFAQSQAIAWFPILYLLTFLFKIKTENVVKQTIKMLGGGLVMILIVFAVHAPWIITSLMYMDVSFGTISNFDASRFSSVISILNSFRGWGSLFNQQYELVFPTSLLLFSFVPSFLLIYFASVNNSKKFHHLFYFAISLIIIPPIILLLRHQIAQIPFSSVIRDSSRFLVISILGTSLGVAVSLATIKNKTILFFITVLLILPAYPFLSNGLFKLSVSETNNTSRYYGKDFRARLLNIPMQQYDNQLKEFSSQTNLLYPLGGVVQTKNNPQYAADFWAVSDIQAFYSPFSSGIYASDKSNPLITNFVSSLKNIEKDISSSKKFLGLYGIDNIINRSKLKSSVNIDTDQKNYLKYCISKPGTDTDWSITDICQIINSRPLIYATTNTVYIKKDIEKIVNDSNYFKNNMIVVGCPENFVLSDNVCGLKNFPIFISKAPEINYSQINDTTYKVKIDKITGPFVLVLNKTFHQGWRITNLEGNVIEAEHILANHLVNGWVITPKDATVSSELEIDFYPQAVYSLLLPISTALLFLLSVYVFLTIGWHK